MSEVIKRVRPTPTDEYLANPHRGCCTFQKFNGDGLFPGTSWSEEGPTEFPELDLSAPRGFEFLDEPSVVTPGYLPTTVSYCRWFWNLLEPQQGKYDLSVIEKSIATAHGRGQSLAIRVMPFGSGSQPQLPEWYVAKYPTRKENHGREIDVPVYDAPDYLEQFGALVREVGRRFDGHPLIESIDVGYLGPWGEGAGECKPERHADFHRVWREAWRMTPRYSEISEEQLVHGIAAGTGYRINCFGDLSNRGSETVVRTNSWNHHFDMYPRAISRLAAEAWKKTPVHLETAWVPMGWYQSGWDIDFILEQGLKYHATYFMPKSSRLPEAWMEKLGAFCNKLGYRFVLRQVLFEVAMQRGHSFKVECWIDNVGVAPIYRPYIFAFRLRHGDCSVILPVEGEDIRTWLPGDRWIDTRLTIPMDFPAGPAELSCGIIEPNSQTVIVKFAVKERFSDGWIPLQSVYVA